MITALTRGVCQTDMTIAEHVGLGWVILQQVVFRISLLKLVQTTIWSLSPQVRSTEAWVSHFQALGIFNCTQIKTHVEVKLVAKFSVVNGILMTMYLAKDNITNKSLIFPLAPMGVLAPCISMHACRPPYYPTQKCTNADPVTASPLNPSRNVQR